MCGPSISVREVYQQKSLKRIEFRERCAVRFQESLQIWHEEQVLKKLKDKSNKEKNRKILEEQIQEVRERKIQKRKESLAKDREYLRQGELVENERLAKENLQRQKTLEYYEELGRIVDEQQQRTKDKIKNLSKKIECSVDQNFEVISVADTTHSPSRLSPEIEVIKDETIISLESDSPPVEEVETNMKKSASDYFNSNEIISEFNVNKTRALGSTIEFNDVTTNSRPDVPVKVLMDAQKNKLKILGHNFLLDNEVEPSDCDANSNDLPALLTDRQKNRAKILESEFGICPVVVKICDTTDTISNKEFQNNQQRSGAHTNIFGYEKIDEFKRNRNRVLTEEFGYTSVDGNKIKIQKNEGQAQVEIAPVDWKPIRTSLSLDFAKNNPSHPDVPTPMSISSDTIHEDVQEVNEPKLKIELPHAQTSSHGNTEALETAETIDPTPDSALNTAGILNKLGFVFEASEKTTPLHQECYNLNLTFPMSSKTTSFFALPLDGTDEEEDCPNLNDLKNVSTTTISNFLKMSFVIPVHARLSILNNEILKIFLQDLDILGHLKSLRNFYFMMDGEFSSCISDGLISRLECTKNPTELFNFQFLHTILHNALNSSILGNDQNADRLSFLIADVPEKFDLASPNVLQTLNLSYHVEWPLNLVLTPEAMSHYARIFQHLLKVRRINWVLDQSYQVSPNYAAQISFGTNF